MKENRLMKLAIKELQENKEKSDEKFKEIEEQLEQIHLRDTIKYSIRYIYRLFYPKFGKNQFFQYNVYDEIKELKNILLVPDLNKFSYLYDFVDAIQNFDLSSLNNKAHPKMDKRNFELIAKYIDNITCHKFN